MVLETLFENRRIFGEVPNLQATRGKARAPTCKSYNLLETLRFAPRGFYGNLFQDLGIQGLGPGVNGPQGTVGPTGPLREPAVVLPFQTSVVFRVGNCQLWSQRPAGKV